MILTQKAPNSPCLVMNLNLSQHLSLSVALGCLLMRHFITPSLGKTSNEAFQALWIELRFASKKNIICGIIYRQHNSPERFLEYFEQTLDKFISTGKNVCVMGDFNLCLLKSEVSKFSHNFLLCLQNCYVIPTTDNGNSASLIDNMFVNNPDCVSLSGNI